MTVTVGINGFGRIGRCTLAHIAESGRNDIHVAKINATGPIETNAIFCATTAFMAVFLVRSALTTMLLILAAGQST